MFSEAKGVQELIELFGQSVNRALAQLQQVRLRPGPDGAAKAVVNVLDDLERLTKVMTGHREKQCFEFAIVFRWSRHFHARAAMRRNGAAEAGRAGSASSTKRARKCSEARFSIARSHSCGGSAVLRSCQRTPTSTDVVLYGNSCVDNGCMRASDLASGRGTIAVSRAFSSKEGSARKCCFIGCSPFNSQKSLVAAVAARRNLRDQAGIRELIVWL